MPTIVIVLAVLGLVGIVASIYASTKTKNIFKESERPKNWNKIRIFAFIIGGVIGVATWPLTYWMGYPIEINEENWRIVGMPFFVAAFDSIGRDYVGVLTMPGVIANSIFWALLPQLGLFLWAKRKNTNQNA